jgi:hypothetical protein
MDAFRARGAVLAGRLARVKALFGNGVESRYGGAMAPSAEKRERRSHFRGKPRPGRRVEVTFTAADGTPVRAFTRNIGVGGAFVVTDRPARPGTPLTLSIHVPTASTPLEVRAEVRWAGDDPSGMGLKFGGLGVEELLLLEEYFASLTGSEE